jgi:hypothetical protein
MRKAPVWVWILTGIAGVMLLALVGLLAAGWFVAKQVVTLAENPRQLAGVIEKADPNLEVLDVDDQKKTIRVRNKKDDTVVTLSLEDVLQGKLSVSREGKDGVERFELGGKVDLPNWVPKFPDAEPRGLGSAQSEQEGEGGVFQITTNAPAEKVLAFYREGFAKRGLSVVEPESTGGKLVMRSEDGVLNAGVEVKESAGERRVIVAYGEKRK